MIASGVDTTDAAMVIAPIVRRITDIDTDAGIMVIAMYMDANLGAIGETAVWIERERLCNSSIYQSGKWYTFLIVRKVSHSAFSTIHDIC